MTRVQCSDCGGSPCKLEFPGSTMPEVCPFPEEEGAEFASWKEVKDRRKTKKGD